MSNSKQPITVSPVMAVKQKDGSLRTTADYRALNSVIKTINRPLPQIQSLPRLLTAKHCWFTVLSLNKAYHAIPLDEDSSRIAAITFDGQTYIVKRPYPELKNTLSGICGLFHDMLSDLEAFVFPYIDEILIFSETLEEHKGHVGEVFASLVRQGFDNRIVDNDKCQYGQKVLLAGYEISNQGIVPDPKEVSAISKMPMPATSTDVRKFLRSINLYRAFIPDISEIVSPLTDFVNGTKKVNNGAKSGPKKTKLDCKGKEAYVKAKKSLVDATNDATRLSHQHPDMGLYLSTKASPSYMKAILEQKYLDGSELWRMRRPLGYFSKALPSVQSSRSSFSRELVALYSAIRYFQYRLRGKELTICINNEPLVAAIKNNGSAGTHSIREQTMIHHVKKFKPSIFCIGDKNFSKYFYPGKTSDDEAGKMANSSSCTDEEVLTTCEMMGNVVLEED